MSPRIRQWIVGFTIWACAGCAFGFAVEVFKEGDFDVTRALIRGAIWAAGVLLISELFNRLLWPRFWNYPLKRQERMKQDAHADS